MIIIDVFKALTFSLIFVNTKGKLLTDTHDRDAGNVTDSWIMEAVLDVAFYLRRHKFLGTDIRFHRKEMSLISLHEKFPEPILRNVHWQVRRNCENSFTPCLEYLASVINEAIFTRNRNAMTFSDNPQKNNDRCLKLLQEDNEWIQEFRSPLDKFQWLISARLFMCWYTCQHETALEHFGESCNNFAACLNKKGSFENNDVRADDSLPFACAFYSFCPDPCCENKILTSRDHCLNSPCFYDDICTVNHSENVDWEGMRSNKWNISCNCEKPGTVWDSRSGMCIDVDECTGIASCDVKSERCMNLPGSYACVCALGYRTAERELPCQIDPFYV